VHTHNSFSIIDPACLLPSLAQGSLLQLMIDATVEGEDGETRGFTDEEIAASSMSFLL